jgi:flagellum-specific peptidoglycan hydrolase FlgJ
MLDIFKRQFLDKACQQAQTAGNIFPEMAACEAALESGYGASGLAISDCNLFGMKQHQHPVYGTHNLPTKEFVGIAKDTDAVKDGWIVVNAAWVEYPDFASCFADRMSTLRRLSNAYPHYAAALKATDPITYVTEVSKTWSTDPNRANKVISIYNSYVKQPAS